MAAPARLSTQPSTVAPVGYLSETARRRIAALLLAVGAVVAVLALADVGPFDDPPTQEERANAALSEFFVAAQAEQYRRVCASLTPERRLLIQQAGARIATQQGLSGCAEIFAEVFGDNLGKLKIVSIADTRVSGNRAAIDAELKVPGAKRPESRTIEMVLIGEDWKLDSFGA
jgi:hypothetical protein